jgi:hypothetical protein
MIPTSWLDQVKVERIVAHWTAGAYVASKEDRKHYHILIEGDGKIVQGTNRSKTIVPPLHPGQYAAHTSKLNSWTIGVAVCCMHDAQESPFDPGNYPITPAQWDALVAVLAQLSSHYSVPSTQNTILTHAEVQTNLGVKQADKWDITVYPNRAYSELAMKSSAAKVGDLLRKEVVDARFTPAPAKAEPTESAAGWIGETTINVTRVLPCKPCFAFFGSAVAISASEIHRCI